MKICPTCNGKGEIEVKRDITNECSVKLRVPDYDIPYSGYGTGFFDEALVFLYHEGCQIGIFDLSGLHLNPKYSAREVFKASGATWFRIYKEED